MNLTKRTLGVFALLSIFAASVVASELGPVCTPPTDGIIQTPPCVSAQSSTDDGYPLVQVESRPTANTFGVASTVEEVLIAILLLSAS
jgi:hypothetical protein